MVLFVTILNDYCIKYNNQFFVNKGQIKKYRHQIRF